MFQAHLQPISFTKFHLINKGFQSSVRAVAYKSPIDVVISNDRFSLVIDGSTGLLKAMIKDKQMIGLRQNFGYYTRGFGKNSGAYAMHTKGSVLDLIATNASIWVIKGSVCQEVVQEFSPYLKQIIRIYKNSDYVEFDWTAGPLPTDQDFELITRFETGLQNNGTFYTDSNGKQTLKRRRNQRPNWTLSATEKVSSNYYPVNSWIYITDPVAELQMSVVPDRAQGGSSIEDGSIELMIHRRLHFDDGYGMEEKLDEPGVDGKGLVVRGRHYLLIDSIRQSMTKVKALSKQLYWKPLSLFVVNASEPQTGQLSDKGIGVSDNIDPSIHLLTLEELEPNVLFVRFESESETKDLSFNLSDVFTNVRIISAVETSITGTETLSEMMDRKLNWICNDCSQVSAEQSSDLTVATISLSPNQIRSFVMKVQRK